MSAITIVEITAYIQASSATSLAVGTGSKTFTLASAITFIPGMAVIADGGSGNTMTGTVTNQTGLSLIVSVASVVGSGTLSSWVIGGTNTFRFSTTPDDKYAGFRTGVSETPALAVYPPRLKNPGNLSRYLFQQGTTYGRSQVGYGNIIIDNTDGVYDGFIDYGFDGQQVVIRSGTTTSPYPSGFTTLFTGTMEQAEFSWDEIKIILRDRLAELYSKPIQPLRFAGTGNEEGGADLKGKPKPIGWGKFLNVTLPLVDATKFIYLINTNQTQAIDAVYDNGVALTPGTARASLSLLQSNTPIAGTYDYYLGASGDGCYIRLATDLENAFVTADGTQGANASDRTMAQIAKNIYINQGGFVSGDISSGSVTALDTTNSSVIGVWIGLDERNIRDVLDEVLNTGGAADFPGRDGLINFVRLELPSGSAEQTYKSWQIVDDGAGIERIASNDTGNGLPSYKIIYNYQRNYTIQNDADVAGSVTDSRKLFLKNEYRTVISADSSIQALHPLAEVLSFNSLFTDSTNAQTESDRRLALYKTRRDMLSVTVQNDYVMGIDLNDVIEMQVSRFGWDAGKKFRVLGMTEDFATQFTTLTVWG